MISRLLSTFASLSMPVSVPRAVTLFLLPALVGALAVSLFILSAPDPKDYVLPDKLDPAQVENDNGLKNAVSSLSEEERSLLFGFLARRVFLSVGMFGIEAMPDSEAKGITVGKAIDLQRAWIMENETREARERALAEKVAAEREAAMSALREAVIVAVSDKEFRRADWRRGVYEDLIVLRLAFANQTDKPVSGVKGSLIFSDVFGTDFKMITLVYDEGIGPKGIASWVGDLRYNQFDESDKRLAHTDLDRIKVRWEPEAVLFADGVTPPLTVNVE